MQSTKYLIVGAGMTGDMAAKGIREHDADGRIVARRRRAVSGVQAAAPHEGALVGRARGEALARARRPTSISSPGRRIVSLDLDAHRATDDAGEEYAWEKLLLATGARPREIPGADGVVWFRTLDDYRRVREKATEGARFVVIGGGFIGSEIAAALVGAGVHVTMVFPEPGIGFRLFPAGLSEFLVGYYREKGVEVLAGETVSAASGTSVTLGDGRVLEADCVVAGLGVIPETELAAAAGLEVEDGIVVDEYGRASGRDDVFAAGDVARFPVLALGTSMRIEHEDHANTHGKARRREHGRRRRSRTTTCRSSTPTCSTSGTRRSGRSTRGSRRSRTGRSRTARASSRTSRTAGRAACCSGTSGTGSTTRAS